MAITYLKEDGSPRITYLAPLYTEPDISTSAHPYQAAALKTAEEGIATPILHGVNAAGMGIPEAMLNRSGSTIPNPQTLPGKALTIGADIYGLSKVPFAIAKAGVEAIPGVTAASKMAGGLGLGARMATSGAEMAAGSGLASAGQPKEIPAQAGIGGLLGAGGELGMALGKPVAAGLQKILAHIPYDEAMQVMKEPYKITKEFLSGQLEKASSLWKQYVDPAIKGKGYQVNLGTVNQTINSGEVPLLSGEKIILKAPNGQPTGKWLSMTPSEQKAIDEISDDIHFHQKDPTFNSAQGIVGKIDRYLQKTYNTATNSMTYDGAPKTGIFEAVMKSLRGQVMGAIATDQPAAATAINEMAEYYKWRRFSDLYKGERVSFMQSLPLRLGLVAGGLKAPVAGIAAGAGTVPAVWGAGIKTAGYLSSLPTEVKQAAIKEIQSASGSDNS